MRGDFRPMGCVQTGSAQKNVPSLLARRPQRLAPLQKTGVSGQRLIKGQKAEFKKKAVDYRKNFAPGSFQLYQTDTLPLQLLIARIPGRKGSNEVKWGCLVFMLGSDLIGKWEAAGYYTELDTIVGVYLSFAYGLMKNAREKFPDEAYEWYPPGRTQPQVSNSQDEEEPEKPDDES